MKRHLIEHLGEALKWDKGFSQPFKVCFFQPFPADLYADVLANLPADKSYENLFHKDAMRSDGTSTRTVLLLDDTVSPFWRDLSVVLCGPEVKEIFRTHLGFGGKVRAVARLLRDFAGYRIAPHPDSSKKACTVQFYLPSDESQSELGTSFYSRAADGSFVEAHKLPFLPNMGYGFKVTENSWHGAELKISKPRNTLIITYYKV